MGRDITVVDSSDQFTYSVKIDSFEIWQGVPRLSKLTSVSLPLVSADMKAQQPGLDQNVSDRASPD